MATIIGSVVVFGLLTFIVARQIRRLRKGGGGCACGCDACSKGCKT